MLPETTHLNLFNNLQTIFYLKVSTETLELLESEDISVSIDQGKLIVGEEEIQLIKTEEEKTNDCFSVMGDQGDIRGHITQRLTLKPTLANRAKFKKILDEEVKKRDDRKIIQLDSAPVNSKKKSAAVKISRTIPSKSQIVTQQAQKSFTAPLSKRRMIHILAVEPRRARYLCKLFRKQLFEVLPMLNSVFASNKIAEKLPDSSKFKLRLECYKDLRPLSWSGYTKSEQQKVMDDCNMAFDALCLPSDATERQNVYITEQLAGFEHIPDSFEKTKRKSPPNLVAEKPADISPESAQDQLVSNNPIDQDHKTDILLKAEESSISPNTASNEPLNVADSGSAEVKREASKKRPSLAPRGLAKKIKKSSVDREFMSSPVEKSRKSSISSPLDKSKALAPLHGKKKESDDKGVSSKSKSKEEILMESLLPKQVLLRRSSSSSTQALGRSRSVSSDSQLTPYGIKRETEEFKLRLNANNISKETTTTQDLNHIDQKNGKVMNSALSQAAKGEEVDQEAKPEEAKMNADAQKGTVKTPPEPVEKVLTLAEYQAKITQEPSERREKRNSKLESLIKKRQKVYSKCQILSLACKNIEKIYAKYGDQTDENQIQLELKSLGLERMTPAEFELHVQKTCNELGQVGKAILAEL